MVGIRGRLAAVCLVSMAIGGVLSAPTFGGTPTDLATGTLVTQSFQVPLDGFVPSGNSFIWPALDPLITIAAYINGDVYISPIFTSSSITVTLTSSDPAAYPTAFVEANDAGYAVDMVVTSYFDTSLYQAYCISSSDGTILLQNGQTTTIHASPSGMNNGWIGCGPPSTLVISSISLTPVLFDLSTSALQVTQNGSAIATNGTVVAGTPAEVDVILSGRAFNVPETRSTTVTIQAGSQPLQSQTVNLADIQTAGGLLTVKFPVTFSSTDVGSQTITAAVDPGQVLPETDFSNNTTTMQVNVEGTSQLPAPTIYYSNVQATYQSGTQIAPILPASTGGLPTTYSVNPPLPAGLTLDPSTGVISGTATSLSSTTIYTVTASNSSGSSTTSIAFTVTPPNSSARKGL